MNFFSFTTLFFFLYSGVEKSSLGLTTRRRAAREEAPLEGPDGSQGKYVRNTTGLPKYLPRYLLKLLDQASFRLSPVAQEVVPLLFLTPLGQFLSRPLLLPLPLHYLPTYLSISLPRCLLILSLRLPDHPRHARKIKAFVKRPKDPDLLHNPRTLTSVYIGTFDGGCFSYQVPHTI